MSPTMIFAPDGTPIAAFGSPGGATIINSVLNVAMNLIDHGMSVQEAIDAPRVSVTATNSSVSVEPGCPAETISGLTGLGYSVSTTEIGADKRREGTVIGLPRPQGHGK